MTVFVHITGPYGHALVMCSEADSQRPELVVENRWPRRRDEGYRWRACDGKECYSCRVMGGEAGLGFGCCRSSVYASFVTPLRSMPKNDHYMSVHFCSTQAALTYRSHRCVFRPSSMVSVRQGPPSGFPPPSRSPAPARHCTPPPQPPQLSHTAPARASVTMPRRARPQLALSACPPVQDQLRQLQSRELLSCGLDPQDCIARNV